MRTASDILYEGKRFHDIHPVGKTNAPDGGKDIIATETIDRQPFESEIRKWIWQCKHSKKSLSRKDISEIEDLLRENKASCYGLFCSNFLTPDAINRLEEKKNSMDGRLEYYGKKELEYLIKQFPDLIKKYELFAL